MIAGCALHAAWHASLCADSLGRASLGRAGRGCTEERKEGHMKRLGVCLTLLVLLIGVFPAVAAQGDEREFVVLYAKGASLDAARAAVKAAGGTIVKENKAIGVATVRTRNPNFATAASQQGALGGAARSKPIGFAPRLNRPNQREDIERLTQERAALAGRAAPA